MRTPYSLYGLKSPEDVSVPVGQRGRVGGGDVKGAFDGLFFQFVRHKHGQVVDDLVGFDEGFGDHHEGFLCAHFIVVVLKLVLCQFFLSGLVFLHVADIPFVLDGGGGEVLFDEGFGLRLEGLDVGVVGRGEAEIGPHFPSLVLGEFPVPVIDVGVREAVRDAVNVGEPVRFIADRDGHGIEGAYSLLF